MKSAPTPQMREVLPHNLGVLFRFGENERALQNRLDEIARLSALHAVLGV
jgi:hypothetical protein